MNTPWPWPRVLGHRGGGTLAPENTLAGLRTAAALGYRGVEFDVMLAADGVPMVIHDETLERTTNGRGRVADTPSQALAKLDAGSWKDARFAGEPLPSFAAIAQLTRALGLWANVEIKPARGHEVRTGEAVAGMATEQWSGAEQQPLLSSFSRVALEAAMRAAPGLAHGLLTESVGPAWRDEMAALGCVSLHCHHARLTEALAREVKTAGYWLLCYTVNDPAVAQRLFGWGVDALVTDRLDLLDPA